MNATTTKRGKTVQIGSLKVSVYRKRRYCDFELLVVKGNYRFQIKFGQETEKDGWQIRVNRIRIWEVLPYGIYVDQRWIFNKEWVV